MKTIKILSIIFIFNSYCFCIQKEDCSKNYDLHLNKIINLLINCDKLSINQIYNAIPKTYDNYFTFYSYTEKDEKNNIAFYRLNNLIFDYSMDGNINVLRSFLLLSEFVDGEYSESYFSDVERIIKKNNKVFCELFTKLPQNKVNRLNGLYLKYCDKNK